MSAREQRRVRRPYHKCMRWTATGLIRAGLTLLATSVLAWAVACSDSPGPELVVDPKPEDSIPELQGMILSDPVIAPALAGPSSSVIALSQNATGDVAYVSLPPGTVEQGERALVRRVGGTSSLTTVLRDGGFDPVPVDAEVGDSIAVIITDDQGATVEEMGLVVRVARPPVVVRTNPPRKKTDVALNTAIVIVFSEPVAGSTLTPSSVRLFRGTTPVAGTIRLLQGSATAAVFESSTLLAANTDYRLEIGPGVRDLDNDPLPTTVTVDFTTGTTLLGSVSSVRLEPFDTLIVPVGEQFQLTAIAYDQEDNVVTGHPVTWLSEDVSIAMVSATGLVTAVAPGDARICAEIGGQTGCRGVAVSASALPVGSISIQPESAVVLMGLTVDLNEEVRDINGAIVRNRAVVWRSLEPALATVSSYGTVTGSAPGLARIEAAVEGKSDTAYVTVREVAAMVVSPASASLVLGEQVMLTAHARDISGTSYPIYFGDVTWTSSDATVATVNTFGQVTAVRAGSASITASWTGHQATASITAVSLSFRSVSSGAYHNCGVTVWGDAYCWRFNLLGEIGNGIGETRQYPYPALVQGGLSFAAVSAGLSFTCGLTTAGAAYCWGKNDLGQVGDGTNTVHTVPVPVSGGHTFATISAGARHACGLAENGEAYCWGWNDGRLGDGTTASSNVPVRVTGELAFAAVSAGSGHTCAVTINGEAHCWGSNSVGQLGDGTTIDRLNPVPVAGGITFATVSAGAGHTCAVTPSSEAYCWGLNVQGTLGDGTTINRSTPVPVSGGLTFGDVRAGTSYTGTSYTCAVTMAGDAYCWGYNYDAQLGTGGAGHPWIETQPKAVVGGHTFTRVSAGGSEICGVTPSGVAYCWGNGLDGTIGSPLKVPGQP